MNKKSKPLSLFRLIEDALAEMPDAAKVRRLIPVAWPMLEVEHSLKIRLEEDLGMVERHVLEAIARFGPVHIADVAELMGLDADIVEVVKKTLECFPGIISQGPQGLSASPDTLERLADGRWSRELVQPYAFLVNGPSGTLAPKEMRKISPMHQLSVDFSGGEGTVRDNSGRELDKVFWIAPSQADGRATLSHLVADANVEQNERFGIPAGTVSVESTGGTILRERWQLALAERLEDGTISIRPACRPDITLLVVRPNEAQKIADLLRRRGRSGYDVLRKDETGVSDQDIPRAWNSHAICQAGDGKLAVTLHNPDAALSSAEGENDKDSEDFLAEKNAASAGLPKNFPETLRIALGSPFLWRPSSCAVRQVHPGDPATAAAILKLRGLGALRRTWAKSDPGELFDVAAWWNETQEKIAEKWDDRLKERRVPLVDLIALARRSSDSALVEFASEIS